MNTRFIRRHRVRERVFEFFSKALLIGLTLLACLWMISGAHAAPGANPITGIRARLLPDGSYAVDFLLGQRPPRSAVSLEFERNFLQLSLHGMSAFPAKTEKLSQSPFDRVFTYQYQPDLARARILLNGPASALKARTSFELTPEGVRVLVKGVAEAAVSDVLSSRSSAVQQPPSGDSAEEKAVQEILREAKASAAAEATESRALSAAPAAGAAGGAAPVAEKPAPHEGQALFRNPPPREEAAGKESPAGAGRVAGSLVLVLALIGAIAFGYRRSGLGRGIGFQKQAKLIEVVQQQGLGPKRSIAVVKVLDQVLVVGMAGDGMSLLANLGSDVKIERFLDSAGGPGTSFTDTLEGILGGGAGAADAPAGASAAGAPQLARKGGVSLDLGIRSLIKKRIEGFKPLWRSP